MRLILIFMLFLTISCANITGELLNVEPIQNDFYLGKNSQGDSGLWVVSYKVMSDINHTDSFVRWTLIYKNPSYIYYNDSLIIVMKESKNGRNNYLIVKSVNGEYNYKKISNLNPMRFENQLQRLGISQYIDSLKVIK